MKTKLIFLVLISVLTVHRMNAQTKDLRADVNQPVFDKILSATKFPLTLFEHDDPFKSLTDFALPEDETTVYFDYTKSLAFATEAFNDGTAKSAEPWGVKEVNSVYRDAIKEEWEQVLAEIDNIVAAHGTSTKSGTATQIAEFTIADLQAIQQAATPEAGMKLLYEKEKVAKAGVAIDGFLKAHLAYARVDVAARPTLTVKSPNFSFKNLSVHTTATGELYMKLPVFKCCRKVLGICICWRVEWKWKRIASLTVSPKFGADVTIRFSESQLKVYAQAEFDKLFLDYYILRELNLKGLANRYLANRKFELYDASKFVASLPFIHANFRIESINLPPRTDGVSIEIVVK